MLFDFFSRLYERTRISMQRKPSFVWNTLILTAAGAIARVLGAVYRIFLSRMIGDDGIGLFQMAYDLAFVLMTVAISGLPLAISKLVAERYEEGDGPGVNRIFTISLLASGALGLLGSLILYFGAPLLITTNLHEPRALLSLQYMAPSVFFIFMMAPFRGYFQGLQRMVPRALSDTIEQIARVAAIVFLVWLWQDSGVEYAAGGASLGVTIGAAVGFLYLLIAYLRRDKQIVVAADGGASAHESGSTVLGRIVQVAVPIIMGSLIWPLMRFVDTMLIHMRLVYAGFTTERATELFGQFSGQAGPLINLPSILTVALAASLVPSIASAISRRDVETTRQQTNLALKLSLVIGLAAAVGLNMLATPVAQFLYSNAEAGPVIAAYAWVILFLLLYQASTSILQGVGKLAPPVFSMLIGVAVKAVLTYILCGMPQFHVLGAGWATAIGMAAAVFINLSVIYRQLGLKIDWRGLVIAPGIAVAAMALVIQFGYPLLLTLAFGRLTIALLLTVGIAAAVYFLILILAGAFSRFELAAIPKVGNALLRVLERLKLVRD